MSRLSPEGPVYQAGTLSGNPVAMAAGLTSLRKLKANPEVYAVFEKKARRLMEGFTEAASSVGIPIVTDVRGSMFGFFFSAKPVKNFDDAMQNDQKLFAKFHKGMLDRGVYLACSSFETGFISTATTDEMIEESIEAAKNTLSEIVK
jgi:glutamate-1-semialdehyde 2,1-aminomutase